MRIIFSLSLLALGCEGAALRGRTNGDHVSRKTALQHREEKEEPLIYLNQTNANFLVDNEESADFFKYQQGWDAQINLFYCSVASTAALLNSLLQKKDLPIDPALAPHPYATQDILLQTNTECINKNVVVFNDTFNGIEYFPYGISAANGGNFIQCHLPQTGFKVTTVHAEDVSFFEMHHDILQALKDPQARVIINYDRKTVGQEGGGHFSPVAGYDSNLDAFLIMDVAKFKYPPAWIPAKLLYESLLLKDSCGEHNHLMLGHLDPQLLQPKTPEETKEAENLLNCEAKSRGYITIHQLDMQK